MPQNDLPQAIPSGPTTQSSAVWVVAGSGLGMPREYAD